LKPQQHSNVSGQKDGLSLESVAKATQRTNAGAISLKNTKTASD
jgi:hypothetical protein